MSATLLNPCADTEAVLPATPFTALQYHFGMLLGVEDLETGQAYPRGKLRLHNAWLHGEGVIWGFNVLFNERRELAVDPGLGVDAAGRELHLDQRSCLDVGKWYRVNKHEPGFEFADAPDSGKKFTAHVVARFKACLARPVPSIADPCDGAQSDTAYSRVLETVELLLRPGLAPDKPRPYHRLRVLFQLEADSAPFDDVRQRREAIQNLALTDQPAAFLEALREFAALDAIDLKPQAASANTSASIFPEEPAELVLANLVDLVVVPAAGDSFAIADPLAKPEVTVRPTLIATSTIQELLNGPLCATDGAGTADAGGPRIDPKSVTLAAKKITFTTSTPLAKDSVDDESIVVSSYEDSQGWSQIDILVPTLDAAATTVTVVLKEEAVAGRTIRLIVRGTGPFPILGHTLIPLAGATGGPAGSKHDGHDFVLMTKRS